MAASGNDYLVTFSSIVGRRYAVEKSGPIDPVGWQPVLTNGTPATDITGTGGHR